MKSIFDQWYDENYQKHLKHHAAYWKCKQTWLAAQKQQLEEVNELRQRVAELEKERDGLISKNQNLFNALMVSTHKKDSMYASIKAASGHLNLYGLFSCVEGDSYDPECADKNVRKANSILRTELTTEINLGDLVRLRDEQIAKLTAERDELLAAAQLCIKENLFAPLMKAIVSVKEK